MEKLGTVKVDDIEVDIVILDRDDKVAAIIDCLSTGRLFTIRELRKCVSDKKIPVSEKTVSDVIRRLYAAGLVVNVRKKWAWAPALDPYQSTIPRN